MKHTTILILTLLFLAPTYYNDSTFIFNSYEHNVTLVTEDRVVIDSEYGRFLLREGQCTQFDTHNWCTDSIVENIVEFWPNTHQINITHERLCEIKECFSYGKSCEENRDCTDYCVNEVCRPTKTWCGDGVCDEEEMCPQDCPKQVPQEENTTQVNQTNSTTEEIVTNQSTQEETQEEEETAPPEEETTSITQEEEVLANQSTQEETQEENSAQEQEQETQPSITARPQGDEPNILGAGITIFGGLVAIIAVFVRSKKKKQEKDLYSYRK